MNLGACTRPSKHENGNGLSLQAQRNAIKCNSGHQEIVEWHEDIASGKNMERRGAR
jgi:hypothetical protein